MGMDDPRGEGSGGRGEREGREGRGGEERGGEGRGGEGRREREGREGGELRGRSKRSGRKIIIDNARQMLKAASDFQKKLSCLGRDSNPKYPVL